MTCFVRNFNPPTLKLIEEMLAVEATPHHHLAHYNLFIEQGDLEFIVEQEVPIKIRPNLFLKFHNVRLAMPYFYDEKEDTMAPLYPDNAILSKRSYSGVVSAEATLCSLAKDTYVPLESRRVDLFKLPIMVGSNRCFLKDAVQENALLGGHFIINGTTRTAIPFIRPNYNMCLVSEIKNDEKYKYQNEFRSRHHDLSILVKVYRDNEGYLFCSLPYIKSRLPAGLVLCAMGYPLDSVLEEKVGLASSPTPMRKCHVTPLQKFLAFNEQSMQRLVQQMTHDDKLGQEEAFWTPDEAIDCIVKLLERSHIHKTAAKLRQELGSEIFVHVGFGYFDVNSAYICYMLRLLEKTALGQRTCDDKESLANKRIDTCHDHMAQLVRSFFRRACKNLTQHFVKLKQAEPPAIVPAKRRKHAKLEQVVQADEFEGRATVAPPLSFDRIFEEIGQVTQNFNITNKIQGCFSTGKWDVSSKFQVQKQSYMREGVSQVLAQQNQLQRISHMRRVTQPIATDSINIKIHNPRQYGPTQNGFICPYETPEGGTVGIVCNFALSAQASLPFNPFVALAVVRKCGSFRAALDGSVVVSINGRIVGSVQNGYTFLRELRALRNDGHLPFDVSICHLIDEMEVRIHVDGGRFTRPLLVVGPDNKPLWTETQSYAEAKQTGTLRYVDAAELDLAVVAMDSATLERGTKEGVRYDFLEVHPTFLLGHNASLTNYSNCNQAPRNSYLCSQGKQAMGANLIRTHDTNAFILRYSQAPLVSTMYHRLLKFDQQPSGCNLMVAVMTCRGFNQEDSVVLNKGAIDRGLFSVDLYHVITDREKSGSKEGGGSSSRAKTNYLNMQKVERWERVPDAIKNPQYLHTDLDERGIVLPHNKRESARRGIPLAPFQVLVSKKLTKKVDHHGKWMDVTIDQSLYLKSADAGAFVDTVETDMDADGLSVVRITLRYPHVPEVGDKVASAHGQKGIIGAVYAEEDMPFAADGSRPDLIINPHAFPSRMTINYIMDMAMGLLACKEGRVDATPFEHNVQSELELLHELGIPKEGITLYDGRTGEKFPTPIFMGPCYYHVLSQLVSKKMYARGNASSGPVDAVRQPVSGRSREGGLRFGEMERDCVIAHGAAATLDDRLVKCYDEWTQVYCNHCRDMTSGIACHICGRRDGTRSVKLGFATKILHHRLQSMGVKLACRVKDDTSTQVAFTSSS